MTRDPFFESLRREIATLAADAETQVRSVSAGLSFAELELQDVDHMLEVMLGERGRVALSSAQLAACRRLKETLDQVVSGEPATSSFWTNDGVRTHPKWAAIRIAAREALSELNGGQGPESPVSPPQA